MRKALHCFKEVVNAFKAFHCNLNLNLELLNLFFFDIYIDLKEVNHPPWLHIKTTTNTKTSVSRRKIL